MVGPPQQSVPALQLRRPVTIRAVYTRSSVFTMDINIIYLAQIMLSLLNSRVDAGMGIFGDAQSPSPNPGATLRMSQPISLL